MEIRNGLTLFMCLACLLVSARGDYAASVVEAAPFSLNPGQRCESRAQAEQVIRINLEFIREQTEAATLSGDQIVVFPELFLLGLYHVDRNALRYFMETVPSVPAQPALVRDNTVGNASQSALTSGADFINACDSPDYSYTNNLILKTVSCIAANYSAIVVVGMGDMQGEEMFNTLIALDETGALVGRYHKMNLYITERHLFNPAPYNPQIFTSRKLGVRFAMMICFDIQFTEPQSTYLSAAKRGT
jgi:predicted amidohydrolase